MIDIKPNSCPICNFKGYKYEEYAEMYGIVERHSYCERCGYRVEQAYSGVIDGFQSARKRGIRLYDGTYLPSNKRKRKRIKRKYNIKYYNTNIFNLI